MSKTNFSLDNLKFIDLTHALNEQTPHWQSSCAFKHLLINGYEENSDKLSFRVNALEMPAGIGTHIDAPAHCIRSGKTVSDISLRQLIRPCVMIDVSAKAEANFIIQPEEVLHNEQRFGDIVPNSVVLFYTGWERFFNQPHQYRNDYVFPSVSAATAELLLERQIAGLGIDTLSPDLPHTQYLVHRLLLGAGKYLIENIAHAAALLPRGDLIFILPLKIENGTEAPVRVFAIRGTA